VSQPDLENRGDLDRPAARRRGDEVILAALAAGHSLGEAAKIAGLSRKTVQRRMADPLFRGELEEVKLQIVQQTAASLSDAATSAVHTLKLLLTSQDEWVQLRSATAILDVSIKYREALDLTERVAGLEERLRELAMA
jgi:hypothetical protein